MKNRLGLVLIAEDMTQNELARKLYVKPQTISHYVRGHRMPTIEMALKIAKALGVKVEDIWEVQMEVKGLSEAQVDSAIIHMIGRKPKFHKGKYGQKFDYHTCGSCGATIEVIADYCFKCGTRVLWDSPRCLSGLEDSDGE